MKNRYKEEIDLVQSEIIRSILNFVIPSFLFILVITTIPLLVSERIPFSRSIPSFIIGVGFLLSLFLNRNNRVKWAAIAYVLSNVLMFLYSFTLNGGINAPLFRSLPLFVVSATFFFKEKTVALILLLTISISLLYFYLESIQILPPAEPAHPFLIWFFTSIYLVITFILVSRSKIILSNTILEKLDQAEEIKDKEIYHRSILDSISDPLVVLNLDYSIKSCNKSFIEWINKDEEILQTTPIHRWLGLMDLENEPFHFQKLISLGYHKEILCYSHSDSKYYLELHSDPLHDRNEILQGLILSFRNVTKEFQLKEQLSHRIKMEVMGKLASGIVHDFNNMLGGILIAAENLESSLEGEDLELLKIIMQAGERASDLTKQLLNFGRKRKAFSSEVDLHKIVEQTCLILDRTLDKSIRIDTDLSATSSTLVGDDKMIQNSLINLAINASQAMPDGGLIEIKTANELLDESFSSPMKLPIEPGSYIHIEIRDQGVGIPKKNQDKIFEPFFSTHKNGEGTGLGLTAVLNTLEAHHGTLTFFSDEKAGTVFHLYFPISMENQKTESYDKAHKHNGEGRRILLVDDEEIIRFSTRVLLEYLNYRVTLASSGEEALEIMKGDSFDLVILDMVMPGINGKETFESLHSKYEDLPVILASGFSKEEDVRELKVKGLKGFLKKPFYRSQVVELLDQIFNKD